jgi:hypothetical protein
MRRKGKTAQKRASQGEEALRERGEWEPHQYTALSLASRSAAPQLGPPCPCFTLYSPHPASSTASSLPSQMPLRPQPSFLDQLPSMLP